MELGGTRIAVLKCKSETLNRAEQRVQLLMDEKLKLVPARDFKHESWAVMLASLFS